MRKLMFVVALSILGAGQVKADSACVAGTLASYDAVGFSCNIAGVLDFSDFSGPAVTASGPGTSPFTAAQVEITPTTVGGIGLIITFPGGDMANGTGVRDVNMPFEVTCIAGPACLNNVFMSITGTATGTTTSNQSAGQDRLTESYCIGGIAPPPTAPCPPPSGPSQIEDILNINPGSPATVSETDTFSTAVSSLSMTKDIGATGGDGSATITQVQDLFLVSTPEPSTILLLGMGLAGLALLSKRRLQARLE